MTEESKERATKRLRVDKRGNPFSNPSSEGRWDGTSLSMSSDVEDAAVDALADSLGQTRLALTRRLPASLWQHKIMPLLTVAENADAQQHGYLVLPESMSQRVMMKPTELHIDTPLSSQLLDFWERGGLLENVTRLTGSIAGADTNDIRRLLKTLGSRLRGVSLTHASVAILKMLPEIPDDIEELVLGATTNASAVIEEKGFVPAMFVRLKRLRVLSLPPVLWCPRTDEQHELMYRFLPETLTTLDSVSMNLASSDSLRMLLKQCPKLVNWTIRFASMYDKWPKPGVLAAVLKGDSRHWRSFAWAAPLYLNQSWEDFLPFANEHLESIDVGMINDGDLKVIKTFLDKCPRLRAFRHHFDFEVENRSEIRLRKFKLLMESTCRYTLTDIGTDWPDWHDIVDDESALYRALPRLRKFDTRRIWRNMNKTVTDVLLLPERKDSLHVLETYDGACSTSAETWFGILKSSTAWTSIRLVQLFDDRKHVDSKRVLTYLAEHCPNLDNIDQAYMCNEVDGPSLSLLLTAMRRRSSVRWGPWYSSSPPTTSPTVRLEHLGTWRSRPRSVSLFGSVLTSITSSDLDTLLRDKSRPHSGAGRLSFLVTRAVAHEFLVAVHPKPPTWHLSSYDQRRQVATVSELDSRKDTVFSFSVDV